MKKISNDAKSNSILKYMLNPSKWSHPFCAKLWDTIKAPIINSIADRKKEECQPKNNFNKNNFSEGKNLISRNSSKFFKHKNKDKNNRNIVSVSNKNNPTSKASLTNCRRT